MADFKHILIGTDFGESSREALDTAVDLATRFDAGLTVVHTYEVPAYAYSGMLYAPADLLTPIEEAARKALEETIAEVQKRVPRARATLRKGFAADELLATIEELHPDLVVMGTHGRHGIGRAVIGSVAERVVRSSPVPVLTVRRRAT